MGYEFVEVAKEGGLTIVTINRPASTPPAISPGKTAPTPRDQLFAAVAHKK